MAPNPWLNVFLVLDGLFLAGVVLWNLTRRRRRPQGEPPRQEVVPPVIDLEARITFEAESVALSEVATGLLDEIAVKLAAFPETNITLEGSADDSGNLSRNRKLSRGRAEAVRRYLVAKGISGQRITLVALEPTRGLTQREKAQLRRTTVRGNTAW